MKVLRISIIIGITIVFIVSFIPQTVSGSYSVENFTLEKEYPIWKDNYGNTLIINQIVNKTTYNTWEPIIITPELINNGTYSVTMNHYPMWILIEAKYPNGVVWPQTPIGIPLIPPPLSDILEPGEHSREKVDYPSGLLQFGTAGKYNITSYALFSTPYNTTLALLPSKPLQITVVPEFDSLAIMITTLSIIGIVIISKLFDPISQK